MIENLKKTCPICFKVFEIKSRRQHTQKYCSKECCRIAGELKYKEKRGKVVYDWVYNEEKDAWVNKETGKVEVLKEEMKGVNDYN